MLLWNNQVPPSEIQQANQLWTIKSSVNVDLCTLHIQWMRSKTHSNTHTHWEHTIFLWLFLPMTSIQHNLYWQWYLFLQINVLWAITSYFACLLSVLRFKSRQEKIFVRLSGSVSGEEVLIKLLIRAEAWTRVEMLVLMSHEYVVLPTGTGPTSSSIIYAEVVGDREKSHKQPLIKLSNFGCTEL